AAPPPAASSPVRRAGRGARDACGSVRILSAAEGAARRPRRRLRLSPCRHTGYRGASAIRGTTRMTGTTRTSDGLEPRRRRILFRAWHRGMREADLLLGTFADAYIGSFGEEDLDDFEALLEAPDGDILAWLTGRGPAPV